MRRALVPIAGGTDPFNMLLALGGALAVPDSKGGYPKPVALDDRARTDLESIIASIGPMIEAATARAA